MSRIVLLSGATGFLGTWIAERLLQEQDLEILALVRPAGSRQAAELRLRARWYDRPKLIEALGGRIRVLPADLAHEGLGLSPEDREEVLGRTTHVIHTAAAVRFDLPLPRMREANVEATGRLLELAGEIHHLRPLARFSHISTAYVAGLRRGTIAEEDLSGSCGFAGPYELTKLEAEKKVRASGLPLSVFRPGMIVGDSRTGVVHTFNTLYFPLRLYLTKKLRVLPCRPDLKVNLVPVDWAADAVVRLTLNPEAEGRCFHLTLPQESLPSARELMRFVRDWARRQLRFDPGRPWFLPLPGFFRSLFRSGLGLLLPYFSGGQVFLRLNTDRLLGDTAPRWKDFLPPLLRYATDRHFLHRSERSVAEQIVYRLGRLEDRMSEIRRRHGRQSRRGNFSFYDISGNRILSKSAGELHQEILEAAAGLKALEVRPLDRVALVGSNSSRYLALDTAINIIGAVTVPMYPTSPPVEIAAILRSSGARLLGVGNREVLSRLPEILAQSSEVETVVSFCREAPAPGPTPARLLGWQDLLALGASPEISTPACFNLGEPATLRYTSGTTGRPKGTVFSRAQVRWMAETLLSLLPWEARIGKVSCLSFLPMNHVVEGILGAYAPYYLPANAKVRIYFLDELAGLPLALKAARPSVFFSVPRFYEKLWEVFRSGPAARLWLALGPGLVRAMLGTVLRSLLLRKAGLNCCAQLIVGSAPVSMELLADFRKLGIEVHNAYGLTEAPLVTLNRLGANHLGSAGTPLPETELRIAGDGEILVRGPQAARGYFEAGAGTLDREGWLATGDLGSLDPEGRLEVLGRKKEVLITSYGKNVLPAAVECRLKEIPGVFEAMLVGEGKPFCAALIWMKTPRLSDQEALAIDQGVLRANSLLSSPERVRRWAVLIDDLSTEAGDLTGNLKLKRERVLRRRAGILEALYREPFPASPPGGRDFPQVLHWGKAPV